MSLIIIKDTIINMISTFLECRCKSTPTYIRFYHFVFIIKPKDYDESTLLPFHLSSNTNTKIEEDYTLTDKTSYMSCSSCSSSLSCLQNKPLMIKPKKSLTTQWQSL